MNVTLHSAVPRPKLPRLNPVAAGLISVIAGLYIALSELDHVLAQVLDRGRTWSPTRLQGPSGWSEKVEGWQFFHDPPAAVDARVGDWLTAYGVTDCLFAICYTTLLVVWLRRLAPPSSAGGGTRLLLIAGAADIAENVQIMAGAPWPHLLVATTAVKWLALVPGVAYVGWLGRHQLKHWLRLAPKAIYTHRYSVLVVLPLALLGLGRGPELLEQVPDIQRRWVDVDQFRDAMAAGFVMGLLMIAVLAIGRQRTDHLWARTCLRLGRLDLDPGDDGPCLDPECPAHAGAPDTRPLPMLAIWFLGPALLAGGAILVATQGARVGWLRLVIFCAIPILIGSLSWLLRHPYQQPQRAHAFVALLVVSAAVAAIAALGKLDWAKVGTIYAVVAAIALLTWALLRRPHPERPVRDPVSPERFRAAAWLGDLMVGLLPVIAGLGAIRAFTAVLAIRGPGDSRLTVALFGAGWMLLGLSWWGLHLALRAIAQASSPQHFGDPRFIDRVVALLTPGVSTVVEPDPPEWVGEPSRLRNAWDGINRQRAAWTILLLSLVVLVAVAMAPVPLAERFGVIATIQLALGSLCVLVAAQVILFQPGGAPEVFWRFGLAFVPVTSLLVVACLFAALVGSGPDVHGIRPYPGGSDKQQLAERPTVPELLDDWLAAGGTCDGSLPGAAEHQVRPLLLYAAEGGGIRAAYWTTATIDRLADTTPGRPSVCRSAFLSSGASGGSVGLSIASVLDPGDAGDAVEAIAGPEALGAASDGLILRDTIFAATGVPLPSLGDPGTDGADWSDRATLIEQAWEAKIGDLELPYLQPRAPGAWDWGPTGALVLNSTSSTTSCRTLISQLRLPGSTTDADCPPGQPAAGSTDLLACTGQLRTTTAALLTARFPYVTPSGVVTCPRAESPENQIVDGGYAENTGVGTLVDLAPRLMTEVRRHNSCVLDPDPVECAGEPAADTIVVPQLVYFDNGTGSDLVSTPGGLALEVLIPPVTYFAATKSLYSARSQLERARATFATDQLWDASAPGSAEVAAAVDEWRPNPVAVVYQQTRPSVAAPLGWVLSKASIETMDDALCDQQPVAKLDYGTIRDVLDLLPGRAVGCAGPPPGDRP